MFAPMFLALSTVVSFPADHVTTVHMDPQTVTATAQRVAMDAEVLVADLPAVQMEPEVVVATAPQGQPEWVVADGTFTRCAARMVPPEVRSRPWARVLGRTAPVKKHR